MSVIKIKNPRTGDHDYEIMPPSEKELKAVAGRLREAQPAWHAMGPEKRGAVLLKFADAIARHREELVACLANDTGRHFISAIEVDGSIGAIKRWAAAARGLIEGAKETGQSAAMPHLAFKTNVRPYALVGCISPWNFPLTLSLIDAIPALMAGCAVLLKPSEVTSRFAAPLQGALTEVPELEAVFDIVLGGGETGAQLVTSVDAVCFTGSVATGRKVGAAAAAAFIPAFLELGGKDPAIVLPSADIDRATTALLRGSIANTGQACQSIERIYVHADIADAFEAQLVEKANAVTLNTQDMSHGQIGPFIFDQQAEIVEAQIEDAKAKGARVLAGGALEDHGGKWLRPTVLADVTPDMALMTQETFGPVLPLTRFDDLEAAISMANESAYGLSAAVFAGTAEEAQEVAARLDVGAVSINDASLTSMMHEAEKNSFKLSGLGASRMGASGLTRFLRKQAILINEGAVTPIAAFDEANAG
ncbi:MAG: aldehyde dehydrogenase family protein [Pseudomonadota bacterium]